MNIFKKLLLIGMTLSMPAFAQVKLLVDDHIKVTAINGESITHGLFTPIKQEFDLADGQHIISVRYERLFDINKNDHDILRSGEVTLSATLTDNGVYRLVMPNQPKRYQEAKEYIKSPSFAIVQGEQVVSKQSATYAQSGGIFAGIGTLFGRENTNKHQVVQAIQTTAQPSKTFVDVPAKASKNTLDAFMALWLNASEEEREKIRQWVQK